MGTEAERSEQPSRGVKTCPECAEEVKEPARVCRFCGYRFEQTPAESAAPAPIVAEAPVEGKRRRWRKALAVGGALLVVAGAIGVVALTRDSGEASVDRRSGGTLERLEAEQRENLKSWDESSPSDSGPTDDEVIDRELKDLFKRELEGSIEKDARKQVRAGLLDGPIKGAKCRYAADGPGATREYECIAITNESGDTAKVYGYEGTANSETGELS